MSRNECIFGCVMAICFCVFFCFIFYSASQFGNKFDCGCPVGFRQVEHTLECQKVRQEIMKQKGVKNNEK